ncbi:hypothetical protein FJ872_25985 [Mesorhizobium sp. B2-5-9]|uniref:hypothetical protein n=1 Tax=unclassified Mesorhizobium TaxID=325217 RepID=UPI00112B6F9E|nr:MULTISPECIES: hypothetical protein [unclassified Mesorhizobium]TPK05505.1 hypothetical protein FJ872_25985 [Mesorhizobium sp. B2-5-9]TPK83914.1 hypothetical protein FJ936_19215 [Mesorhizobium sp. B2-4-13]
MKLIVVTPAGREKYLRLLGHHVLKNPDVHEWHLWDNCRNEADRAYLQRLAASDPRCKIKRLPHADGGINVIGDFYRFCDDPGAFYLRLDDDVVFVEDGFFRKFMARVMAERGSAIWYAPLIVNNAICNSLIKQLSRVRVDGPLTCQASCEFSWAHATFPQALHPVFIEAVRSNRLQDFRVPDREIRLSRFSINAIGFFGSDIVGLGEHFQPRGDEEEWLSATLPAKLDRPGKIFGDLLVAHFSFYTQERQLLRTNILEGYYELAGLAPPVYEKPPVGWREQLRQWRRRRRGSAPPRYTISLPAPIPE